MDNFGARWRNLSVGSMEKIKNEHLEQCLKTVYSNGFNIYALINRWKKLAVKRKYRDLRIPDEVLITICNQYMQYRPRIISQWPWFITVLKAECEKYNARQVITEHEQYKTPGPVSLADLLKMASKQEVVC